LSAPFCKRSAPKCRGNPLNAYDNYYPLARMKKMGPLFQNETKKKEITRISEFAFLSITFGINFMFSKYLKKKIRVKLLCFRRVNDHQSFLA
jgi:hypothetical protein